MLPSFCNQTVTRIRPAAKESRGSIIPDWSQATEKDIGGCSMQPASTSLSQDGRVLGLLDEYTLFLPPDADVMAGDRIRYNGQIYQIDGDVRIQPAPLRLDHIEIRLRRHSG